MSSVQLGKPEPASGVFGRTVAPRRTVISDNGLDGSSRSERPTATFYSRDAEANSSHMDHIRGGTLID